MGKKKSSKKINKEQVVLTLISLIILVILAYVEGKVTNENSIAVEDIQNEVITTNYNLENIPDYSERPYIEINNNNPFFEEDDYIIEGFEKYSELDKMRQMWSCIC